MTARALSHPEPTSPPLLEATGLHRTYRLGRVRVPVLRGVEFTLGEGEFVAVLGASGSGKSTLLHLLGGLDRPDRGAGSTIRFRGTDLQAMPARELNRYRSRDVGFVFQFYHLLPELRVLENVLLGAMVRHGRFGYRARRKQLRARAVRLVETVGLRDRLGHRPVELSGGERQRVALARALMNDPSLLLADEPTGNLDRATGQSVLDALLGMREVEPRAIVMVTHDPEVAERADRVVHLRDGRVGASEASPVAVGGEPSVQTGRP